MTEETPVEHAQHSADSVVEQAVERAATKVAAAATPTSNGTPLLSKMGSITAVALIITVGMLNLVINVATRADLKDHQHDFRTMCQVFVNFAPPEQSLELAKTLAECLK